MTQTDDLTQPLPVEQHYSTPQPGLEPFLHLGKDHQEQIKINQPAIAYIRSLRERELTEEEETAAEETWEFVKKVIDGNRSRKFFS